MAPFEIRPSQGCGRRVRLARLEREVLHELDDAAHRTPLRVGVVVRVQIELGRGSAQSSVQAGALQRVGLVVGRPVRRDGFVEVATLAREPLHTQAHGRPHGEVHRFTPIGRSPLPADSVQRQKRPAGLVCRYPLVLAAVRPA